MFESIVVSILNSVLGKYIKDLDSSNLRLGILKGKQTFRCDHFNPFKQGDSPTSTVIKA